MIFYMKKGKTTSAKPTILFAFIPKSHFREKRLSGKDARFETRGVDVNFRLRANFLGRVLAVLRFGEEGMG